MFLCANREHGWRDTVVNLGRPGPVVIEAPWRARKRLAVVLLGVSEVAEIDVLQQVNRAELALKPLVLASRHGQGVLDQLIDLRWVHEAEVTSRHIAAPEEGI